MDAFVQLALIEKSKRIFASDDNTFLSFPLVSPLAFSAEEFEAMAKPDSLADYALAADFARQVNFIPRDIVASPDGDKYVWDIYRDVLARAQVAAGGQGTGQSRPSILYDVSADGSRTESALYVVYRQYRDQWIIARENYASHKLTGETTDDPAERKRWVEVDEPALRTLLSKAESDWASLGHRGEVEAALLAEAASAANDPIKRWKEWSDAFNPDIDLLNDQGGAYAPTGVSPRDFATNAAWPRFELSAGEMAKLVAEAPEQLKAVLGGQNQSAIDRVSFEYRSVALVRPWFQAMALTSRIWRSSDPELLLSDGGSPATGACPAYVSALVFIRNISVVQRVAVPVDDASAADLRFTIQPSLLTTRRLKKSPEFVPNIALEETAVPLNLRNARAFKRLDQQSLKAIPVTDVSTPAVRFFATSHLNRVGIVREIATETPTRLARTGANLRVLNRIRRRRFRDAAIQDTGGVVIAEPIDDDTPPPPAAPEPNAISVLAFICKRLPKTPDARGDLNWP